MSKPAYWVALDDNKIDGVDLIALAKEYGTPLYVYDEKTIQQNLANYFEASILPKIHYAVKANNNLAILKKLNEWGAGFDIVSLGELEKVLIAGGIPEQVIFSGVGKTEIEITRAIEIGIGCINIESTDELDMIVNIAKRLEKTVRVSLRVNPDVDAKTHPYISTGMKDNKFGIAINDAFAIYQKIATNENLKIVGISCHIGSQITTLLPFIEAFKSIVSLADELAAQGICLEYLDIGGGLGIQMEEGQVIPTPQSLITELYNIMGNRNYDLHLQPGRSLVGNAGVLLSKVIVTKKQSGKDFVIIDAAMNDYIRPTLYQAKPPIINLSSSNKLEAHVSDIVGPICESGDCFVKNLEMSAKKGDILVIGGVGAYGMSMSSQYNSRPRAAEVLIKNGMVTLIRKRDNLSQMWENEIF